MTIKNLNQIWHKNSLRQNEIKRNHKESTTSLATDSGMESYDDPGSPPLRTFMPPKVLLIKIILKAAFADEKALAEAIKAREE